MNSGEGNMRNPMEIDLHRILRDRLPRRVSRFIPGFMISGLEKIICQKELNRMLQVAYPAEGAAFATRILRHLDIEVEVEGLENVPAGRLMFAGNHPLGGLDGIALISVLGKKYGDDGIRFLVNDMLMHVEPLRKVFLPINKYGSQGRAATVAINEALASDMQVFQFPAGLVSRLHPDGKIADLEWQKAFVAKAIEYERDIVPVRFEALNRMRFYRLAKWRKKLGIKVNIEQAFLPAEVCASRGKRFKIRFGKPVSWRALKESGLPAKENAARIRRMIYENF